MWEMDKYTRVYFWPFEWEVNRMRESYQTVDLGANLFPAGPRK